MLLLLILKMCKSRVKNKVRYLRISKIWREAGSSWRMEIGPHKLELALNAAPSKAP